jgi:L-rhamnose-H+ transport protein
MNVLLGVFLHLLGGVASGSFYIPFKKVNGWAWETAWLVGGVFSWILAPWVVAWLTVPNLLEILKTAPSETMGWCYFFGALWGIGGLTFGLSMRYLGMSLGRAVALGFCSAFGTLIPPIAEGRWHEISTSLSGQFTLWGVSVCLIGIAVCGWAGIKKERESNGQVNEAILEFNLKKGLLVATFSGILSACFSFGLAAGKPIADLSRSFGTNQLWQSGAVLIVVLAGGFTTNAIWCIWLNISNKTGKDYLNFKPGYARNLLFCAVAGITWYLQFMFYGMGASQMGEYEFTGWTLHMAFIIAVSNVWGLVFKEWKGSSKSTLTWLSAGIFLVVFSTVLVGVGNYLNSL